MNHGKQQILLYSFLITLSSGQTHGALTGTSALVSSEFNALAIAANDALGTAVRQGSGGSGSNGASQGSDSLLTNASALDLARMTQGIFDSESTSNASQFESSDSTPQISKQVELREATEAFLKAWASNSKMIQSAMRAINNQSLLRVLEKNQIAPSAKPAEQLTVWTYADALYNASARQQQAFFIKNPQLGVIPANEVEILAPIEANGITVAVPPLTYEISFSPKQKLYLMTSYLAEHRGLSPDQQNKIINGLAGVNYEIAKQNGVPVKPWTSMSNQERKVYVNIARKFVESAVSKMRENFGKIQQAIAETLQAQDAADQNAQGSAIDLFEQFKTKFNQAQDSGVYNWVRYKFTGKENPKIDQLFIGSDLPVLRQYVEGALEVMVYDLVPYSSIVKMSQRGDELSTEFAKICTSNNGQRLLNFMIFGAAFISGGAAAASDDEDGVKARLEASYIAMQLKMGENATSADLVRTFGELAWYSITGKVLTIDPVKYANMMKVAKVAQNEAEQMVKEAEDKHDEFVPLVQLVQGAILDMTPSQAYGLNFRQPLEKFIADVNKLNPNPSLTRIMDTMDQDPRAALALYATLFDVSANASLFAKAGWLGTSVLSAVKKTGKAAAALVASNDSSGKTEAQVADTFEEQGDAIADDLGKIVKSNMDQTKKDVNDGKITVEGALYIATDDIGKMAGVSGTAAKALSNQVNLEDLKKADELQQERQNALRMAEQAETEKQERAARELAAEKERKLEELKAKQAANQQVVNEFTQEVFAGVKKIQEQEFKEVTGLVDNMGEAISEQRKKELLAKIEDEKKRADRDIFIKHVTASALVFADILQKLKLSAVNKNDVARILSRDDNPLKLMTIQKPNEEYLRGYLQGLALVNKVAVDVNPEQVVKALDVIKAIVRR